MKFRLEYLLCMIMVILLCGGCNTTRIPKPSLLKVPDGLDTNDVEQAIATALNVVKDEKNRWSLDFTPTGATWGRGKKYNWWYAEDFQTDLIYAGYSEKIYYLQVAIHYDTKSISIEITDSRNLRQSESRIHRTAPIWVSQLEDRIRMSLGRVDQMKAGL